MENSEKIFLLTNEGVDYFIDTETYRLFTDSEQKTIMFLSWWVYLGR